jgi:hypothetical protein
MPEKMNNLKKGFTINDYRNVSSIDKNKALAIKVI